MSGNPDRETEKTYFILHFKWVCKTKLAIPIPPVMQRGCKVLLTRNLENSFCGLSPDHKVSVRKETQKRQCIPINRHCTITSKVSY